VEFQHDFAGLDFVHELVDHDGFGFEFVAAVDQVNLGGVNLAGAIFQATTFVGATSGNVTGRPTSVDGSVNLVRGYLWAVGAKIQNADLRGIKIAGKNLSNIDLSGSDLTGASLTQDNLTSADLHGARLNGADLSGSTAGWADFKNADLSSANLTRVMLGGSSLSGAIVTGTVWSNTQCPDYTWSDNDAMTCVGHGAGL
jgi:uncharacterized protein YjbI with pentapeptide repeats